MKLTYGACALTLLLALSGCSAQPAAANGSTPAATGSAVASTGSTDASSSEKTTPITADMLVPGSYEIDVDSSSSMFRIVAATLDVTSDGMTCTMTLSGTGYEKLYMGTGEQAAAAPDEDCSYFVEGTDGSYSYTVAVPALDSDVDCAAFSIRKQKWYDRVLVFRSDSLPADAFAANA